MNSEDKISEKKHITSELRITLIYLIAGILWIIATDYLVSFMDFSPWAQTLKGIAYVFLTALLVFFLVRREALKQERIKQIIKNQEKEYAFLVENQDDLLVKVDTRGRFLFVNEKYCTFFGKKREELLHKSFMPLVHEDDRHATRIAMEKLYNPPYKAEMQQRVLSANGWKWLEWKDTAILDKDGKVTEIIGIGRDVTVRIKDSLNLKKTKEELETFFALTPDLSCIASDEGRLLKFNQSWKRILGYSEDELYNMTLADLVHPEDLKTTQIRIDSQYGGEYLDGFVNRLKCRDGTYKTMEWASSPSDENNVIYAVARDITDRLKINQKLKESEEKYRHLFERSKDPILIIQDREFIDCNPETLRILGYDDKSEIIGKSPYEISPEFQPDGQKSRDKATALINEAFKNGYNRFEWLHLKKSGEPVWLEVALTPIKERGMDLLYTLWRDITTRKKNEEKLAESQNNFNLIAEHTSDFILILDAEFKITYISPSVVKALGYEHEDLQDQNIFYFIPENDVEKLQKKIYSERQSQKKSSTYINRAKKKDKSIIWIELSIERIFDGNSGLKYAVCIGRDVTERIEHERKLEKALEKAQESDLLKSSFLANMSHEIRTPLNGILGFSEIVATDEELDETTRTSYVQIIKSSGEQLLNILNDILDISKIESRQLKLNIQENQAVSLIEEIQTRFKNEVQHNGLQFKTEIPEQAKELIVIGDYHRILQILGNLMTNAIKFTYEGSITIGIIKTDKNWAFFVSDTGIGIDEEFKVKIWERFTQSNNEKRVGTGGTGIGLAICKSLTELMNGKIWFTSMPSQGSTFYVSLPNKHHES